MSFGGGGNGLPTPARKAHRGNAADDLETRKIAKSKANHNLSDGWKKKRKKKKGGLHLLVQKEIYYNKSQNLNFLYHKLIQLQLSWSVGRKDEKIRL